MMRSSLWSTRATKEGLFAPFLMLALSAALLGVGVLEGLAPSIIANVLPAADSTRVLTSSIQWLIIGGILMCIIIVLRQDELAATIVVALHLYLDWYLGLEAVSQVMALVLLLIFFLAQSPRFPWVVPRALWLWVVFLILTISPAIHGVITPRDALYYYPNIIFGALIMFWLGAVVARSIASVRRLFQFLSTFGTLIAIHTIIQATTGILLLGSSRFDSFLATALNLNLPNDIYVHRAGSFLVDPNWNGTFFAMMLFIPLGLFIEASLPLKKILYLLEMLIMVVALLFTYSAGAWVATSAGLLAFIVFAGRAHYRFQIPLLMVVAIVVVIVWFPSQLALLLEHATGVNEVTSRTAAWETGLNVIRAFPLTGVGLGLTAYLQRAEPYRVAAQVQPLAHPHNSYLELGAMAGLPVLIVFVALLSFALWLALRNWALADARTRSLLSSGIAAIIALSINSLTINGWTLSPLAAIGWLILGVISSSLLMKSRNTEMTQEKSNTVTNNFQ